MANDINIKLLAGLDMTPSEQQLIQDVKELQKRLEKAGLLKIKMSAELDKKLIESVRKISIDKDIGKSGKDIGANLATQLINGFNIKGKDTQKQIRDLVKSLANISIDEIKTGNENSSFMNILNLLGETIEKNANIIKARTGIYDDFFQYFQGISKIKIPNVVRQDLGDDWNNMRMVASNKFVVNKAGTELDSIYNEMSAKFKDLFSGTTDQTKQFREIVNAIKAYRADVDQLEPIDVNKLTGFSDDMWDTILVGISKMREQIKIQLPQITDEVTSATDNIKKSLLNIDVSFRNEDLNELTNNIKDYFTNLTGLTDKDIKLKFFKDANEDITEFNVSLNKGQGVLENYKFALDNIGEFSYIGGSITDISGKEFSEVTAKAAELQNRLESLKSSFSGFLSGTSQTNPFKALVESIDFSGITDKRDLEQMVNLLRQAEAQAKSLNASVYKQWSSNASEKMNQNIKEMSSQIDILESKFNGANFRIPDNVINTIKQMRIGLSTINNMDDPTKKIFAYNQLQEQLKQLASTYTLLTKEQKNYNDSEKLLYSKQKLGSDIVRWMVQNKDSSKEFDAELIKIITSMQGINKNSDLSVVSKQFDAIKSKAEATNKVSSGLWTNMKEQMAGALSNMLKYQAAYAVINRTRQAIRDMIKDVEDLQSSLIEFNKVANVSQSQLEKFSADAYEMGTRIARTGKDIIDGMSEFRRAGYNLNEIMGMSEAANVMVNVADGIDSVADSASSLIAILRGYDIDSSNIMSVVSMLNEVSNNSPVGFQNLADGLERTSGTLAQTGTSLEENIGLLTGGFAQLRNMEKVSNGLITISQRLRGVGEDGEMIDGLSAKLKKNFAEIGIAIEDTNGNLRSTYDIINDYAKVFPTLTSKQRQFFGELASGKRQVTVWNAMVSGINDVNAAIEQANNSMGSAERENQIYMNSITGAKNAYQNAMDTFAKEAVDDQWISDFIAAGTAMLNTLTNIISTDTVVRDSIGDLIGFIRDLAESLENLSNNKFIAGFAQAFITFKALDMATEIAGLALGTKDAANMFRNLLKTVKGYSKAQGTAANTVQATTTVIGEMTDSLTKNKKGIIGCVTALGKFAMAHPAITITTLALGVGYKMWDTYSHRVEDAKKNLGDSRSDFDSVKDSISDINEELQKNIDRIDELNAKDKLTYVDQSELEKLKTATKELERQSDIKNKEAADAATKLSKDNRKAFNLEYGDDNFSVSDVELMVGVDTSALTLAEGGIEGLAAAILKVREAQKEAAESGDDEWLNNMESAESEFVSKLTGHLSTLQEYKDNLNTIMDFRDLTDDEQAFFDNLESGMKLIYTYTDPAGWNNMEINSIFSTEGIEKIKSELVEMAKAGTLTPEIVEGYTNLNKAIKESDLILQDGQTAVEAFTNEIYALAESQEKLQTGEQDNPLFESKSMTDTITQLDTMAEKWQKVNDLYTEFKKKGTGGFSTEGLSAVAEAFKEIENVNIEGFLSTLSDSSSTADQVQSAFDKLATEYIYSSDCLKGLTDATAEQIIKELELQGIENASVLVTNYLAAAKVYATEESKDLADATTEEILAFINEENATNEVNQYLAAYALQKELANGVTLTTDGDIENIKSLMQACGEGVTAIIAFQNAKSGLMETMKAGLPSNIDIASDPIGFQKAIEESAKAASEYKRLSDNAQNEINSAMARVNSKLKANTTGTKDTSSGGGGSSSDSKTKELKEEFNWLQRLDEYYQKQHDIQSKIAEDETASYSERIAALKEMTNLDKERMGSATKTASEYLNKWDEIKEQLDPKYIAKIMYGDISDEEITALEDSDLADQIELIKLGIDYYDKWQDAEEKKLELQEECTDRLREELELQRELIQAQQEQLKSEMDIVQSKIDYIEASGGVVTSGYYEEQIRLSEQITDSLEDQIDNLRQQIDLVDEGSIEYYSLQSEINDCEQAIMDAKTQQAEWNEQIKRFPIERLQKYINMLKAIKQELDDFLTYQETIGQVTTKDQYQQLIQINEEQIKSLQKQASELQGILGDYKYGSTKFNEVAEELSDIQNETASLVNEMQEYNNQILNIPIENLQKVNEELERYSSILSGVMSDYDSALDAVLTLLDDQNEAIEKQREETEKLYEEQIEPLQDSLNLLEKANTAREKQISLEKAQYEFEKARNQKTTELIRDGRIVYESNQDDIRDAQENLQDAEYDMTVYKIQEEISRLEEERDKILENLEDEQERLDDISEKWTKIREEAEKYANTLKADAQFGEGWQDKVLSGNDDDLYNAFNNLYQSTNQNQVLVENQIQSNEKIIEMMQVFVDRFIDGSITYENALSGITELSNSIKNGYTSLEELNGMMNIDGLESMASIAGSVENQINESVSMLAEYIDVAKINNDAISAYTQTWEEMSDMIRKQLEALKTAAEALEQWVKNQKYNRDTTDSDNDGDNIDYNNNQSTGIIESGMNGGNYSESHWDAGDSPYSDDDEFHDGIEKGTIGKAKRSRVDFLKEIATKDMKPGERYIKALDTEVILTEEQQDQIVKNFNNLSAIRIDPNEKYLKLQKMEMGISEEQRQQLINSYNTAPVQNFVPMTNIPKNISNNTNSTKNINIHFGDLNLPNVHDVDKFAKELGGHFNLLMSQALGKDKWNH